MTESFNQEDAQSLVLRLREANQNLVLATMRAQQLQAEAEAAMQRQDEFLSMLAHELRNPLAPISMAAALLGRISSVHPQLPAVRDVITRQVSHMKQLVDDLVDASRISTGKITFYKRTILLTEIIDNAVETSQPFLAKRHQTVTVDLPAVAIWVDGDLVRLSQVFSNLIINAAKYGPENETVSVRARLHGNVVSVSVIDNGPGIPSELQSSIFDLFTQAPRTLDRSQGGLGIGLFLVRNILQMHDGTVRLHSDPTVGGTEFVVELAVSTNIPLDEDRSGEDPAHHQCKILLVEDNVDANQLLTDLLINAGHDVTSKFDGVTGLAAAREGNFDVIVCDIGLPGLNGFQMVKQLTHLNADPAPCLIAMTGYSQSADRLLAEDAGFNHYLVKPVEMKALETIFCTVVPQCDRH
jgi:nitrogen-specific signal transduction histidine kinase/ActR/RegA family two-component response regulator